MPVVLEGHGNGPTILYQRIQLTGVYLRGARKSAESALAFTEIDDHLEVRIEHAILTVILSTLALEAAANQFAEDIFSGTELADFDRLRKAFRKPENISATVWKWHKLFAAGPKVTVPLSDPVLIGAERLVRTRHMLSHYRPQDASRKIYYEPTPPAKTAEGMYYREFWNADMKPSKVEPSLVERELLGEKPMEHFRAAWDVLYAWEIAHGGDGSKLEQVVPHPRNPR
jgi:hypothetical protein